RANVLKADETTHRGALAGCLALQLKSELDKEGLHGLKVVDDDEDVVHPFKDHIGSGSEAGVRPPVRKSPGRTASHRGTPYRCFLPDLTRFGAPAAQDPGSSQRAVKRGGIVIRTG